MGEEGKQEEPSAEVNPDENKEEKQDEKKEDDKKEDDKKEDDKKEDEKVDEKAPEEEPPPPPAPLILSLNLHCMGCVKKIERTILKCRGVEGVEMDMESNQVLVKGLVDPEALCSRIRKRTRKEVKVISPVLPPHVEGDDNKSQLVASQVGDLNTVELHVNMHCEACAQQLRRKLLKMRGVLTVDTDLSSCQVKVTGTMDTERLLKYVYKCTRKQVRVVPQSPKEEEKNKDESEKTSEDQNPSEDHNSTTEDKKEEKDEQKMEAKAEEEKKEAASEPQEEEKTKEDKDEEGESKGDQLEAKTMEGGEENAENAKRMVYYWAPMYTIERLPPPQLFSDENPNACSIL